MFLAYARTLRLSPSSSLRPFLTTRSLSAKPVKTKLPPRPLHPTRQSPTSPSSRPTRNLKEHAAAELYKQGVREIYVAPSHMLWHVISWGCGLALIGGAVNIWHLGHWDAEHLQDMGSWQKNFIASSNRITMVLMTILGGYSILRYSGFMRSIRLVDLGRGNVMMDIHIRRRVPWSKTRYTVPAGDIVLPRRWQDSLPEPGVDSVGSNAKSIFGSPLKAFKSFIWMDGVVSPVRFNKNEAAGMLDPRGLQIPVHQFERITSRSDV